MAVNMTELPAAGQRIVGHILVSVVLFWAAAISKLTNWSVRTAIGLLDKLFGAFCEWDVRQFHKQRESNEPTYLDEGGPRQYIDEVKTLSKSDYPFSPEVLIAKTKTLLSPEAELGSKQPDLLAQDYQFVFPVVGPLDKTEFCTIFGGFNVKKAFPDFGSNYFGFTVDPLEPNRVWFFSRAQLVHEGTLSFGAMNLPATGKTVTPPPQVMSASFDCEGKCYKFTGGYSVDRTVGNTGGLGGLFGIIHSVGGSLPYPEGKPWMPSPEWELLAKRIPQIAKEWKKVVN